MKKFFTFGRRFDGSFLLHLFKSTCLLLMMLISNQLYSQVVPTAFTPASCGNVNCTANDVRVIDAYLSGPGGTPINCLDAQPFLHAELHLVVFSNTQRKGVSISGNFNTLVGTTTSTLMFANCFKGITLNNSGNNDLSIAFPLADAVCGDGFNLTNLFVSWGTGKQDFCDGSTDGHCPETPSKCRYTPGETIPVSVKLEVDFTSVAGVCADGGNSKTFDFTPSIVTEKNIIYPVTFTWDFGDGSATETTTASSLADVANAGISHTYASENTYTVTLVGNDASPDPNTVFSVTSTHHVISISCCDLVAPISGGDKNGCSGTTLTATATGGAGETITWFDAATDGNEVADPSLSTVGAVTYYAESSTSTCVSPDRTPVTLTIAATPDAPVLSVTDNCDGTSTVSAKTAGPNGTLIPAADLTWSNGGSGNPITVTTTDEITATVKAGDCTSGASNAVTPAPKTRPDKPVGSNQNACSPASLTATATGSNITWYDAATDGNIVADPTINTVTSATYYAESSLLGCVSTERTPVTLTISLTPDAPVLSVLDNCDGTSTVTAKTAGPNGTLIPAAALTWSNSATGNPITVTATTSITATVTTGDCTSGSSNAVTPAPKTRPAKPVGSDQTACSPASLTATATGSNVTWYDAAINGNLVANPTLTSIGSVTYYAEASLNGCSSTERTAITLSIRPTPSCTISNTTSAGSHTALLGAAIGFSGPTGANFKYAWSFSSNTSGASFSGSSTATTQTVSVTATTVGSYTLSLKVTDETYTNKCNSTCTYSMTITPTGPFYTVTQGFYGNVGGKVIVPGASCSSFVAGTKGNVDGLIAASIKLMPSATLKLGITANNKTFTMGATATEDKNLITYLPAGQAAAVIAANAGSNNNTNITTNLPKLNGKKISSILLGQTITLKLNVFIPGNTLGSFVLKTGYLTTQKADLSKCPTIKLVACTSDAAAISSKQLSTSAGLNAWINSGTKTVTDLLNLASDGLGGGALPAGVTLANISDAIDVINNSFDGARYFLGYYPTAKSCSAPPAARPAPSYVQNGELQITRLTVAAYPNPFSDKVKFSIASPVSGNASLDIYNVLGQRVANLYSGYLNAGTTKIVEYKAPLSGGSLIYTLRVGDKQVNGKVIQVK